MPSCPTSCQTKCWSLLCLPVLTHDVNFTSHTDVEYLKRIRLALWFVLEPLMTKNENYSFGSTRR